MTPSSPPDIGKKKEVFSPTALSPGEREGSEFKYQMRHAVLAALVLWVFGCNVAWVVLDEVPLAYDYARHLYITFLYWQAFDWGSQSLFIHDILKTISFGTEVS